MIPPAEEPESSTQEKVPADQEIKLQKLIQALSRAKLLKEDRIPAEIFPEVYLGSYGAAHNKALLKQIGITHVLCVASSIKAAFPELLTYKSVEVLDNPEADLAVHFAACFAFINEAIEGGGKVLIHCFAGKSRSATVLLAWIMKHKLMPLDEAIAHVKGLRSVVSPNAGFMKQLRQFEAVELVDSGVATLSNSA
ncbi:hypothetical protein CYMTET_40865 [Cymbomonas tetramitiformis]|uniref:Protein-serine/threonine phosphatase n=1 Tax=Cymbomonas tetramitiformis TaxID=36881 RepID=A0AAE0C8B1_9CHLO|nr:hypothetical protein CYMTET_40865 [Cymbomonas tetramitiformis]